MIRNEDTYKVLPESNKGKIEIAERPYLDVAIFDGVSPLARLLVQIKGQTRRTPVKKIYNASQKLFAFCRLYPTLPPATTPVLGSYPLSLYHSPDMYSDFV
jgi:hypothetical protein